MIKSFNLHVLFLVIAVLSLAGCGSQKDAHKGMSAAEIYAQAEQNMAKENYAKAVKDFEALEARFPYGEYSDKAQFGLMTAYYKRNESALALASIDRFIRMNPRHPKVDYAYYLKGKVNFDQNHSFMYRHLPLDRSARETVTAQDSYNAFQELVERYPQSSHVKEAQEHMYKLRDQLANHELSVIEYYMKRGAYLSAANRANFIIRYYDGTEAVPAALSEMSKAYRKLGMESLADEALNKLKTHYPTSSALKKAKS